MALLPVPLCTLLLPGYAKQLVDFEHVSTEGGDWAFRSLGRMIEVQGALAPEAAPERMASRPLAVAQKHHLEHQHM